MPRQHRYLLQRLERKGAQWRTIDKLKDERAAIFAGDILARTTDAWELRIRQGTTDVEHWILRDKPERVR